MVGGTARPGSRRGPPAGVTVFAIARIKKATSYPCIAPRVQKLAPPRCCGNMHIPPNVSIKPMYTLEKLSLIACGLLLSFYSCSQPLRVGYLNLNDYSTILNDLKQNGNRSIYYGKLDYESMLYLDPTSFKVLNKVNPSFLREYNIDTANIFHEVPETYVNELSTKFTSIEQLISNSDSLKKTILRLKNENLDNKPSMIIDNDIYIKDHQKAIITVRRGSWSITYRVILTGEKLRFEELYQVLE